MKKFFSNCETTIETFDTAIYSGVIMVMVATVIFSIASIG